MSLPNYLAKIKSAGVYKFVTDDSVISTQEAETLRLVVGFSEKGPFNTPVYIENKADFITIFGNVSKRLEKRGVYFHRMAIQALQAGPILALNIKPFTTEKVSSYCFNPASYDKPESGQLQLTDIYNTNRFWYLDANNIQKTISAKDTNRGIYIAATDTADKACTLFIRKYKPTEYNMTIRDWYTNNPDHEMPSYLEPLIDENLNDFFMEIFVFRGEFTESLIGSGGTLSKYFTERVTPSSLTDNPEKASQSKIFDINSDYRNIYNELADALVAMANDPNSNFLARYQGCTLPYFKDANGRYISLDLLFNTDNYLHGQLMKIDDDGMCTDDASKYFKVGATNQEIVAVQAYIPGYTYTTIDKSLSGKDLVNTVLGTLSDKGLRTALTNNVDSAYHYLIDTFRSYSTDPRSKDKLFDIAKAKGNCFALVNFPFMIDFVNDVTYQTNDKFDISKIHNSYQMPAEGDGASWGAYFTSLVFSDGTVKETVPSAACVSNNFMDKYGTRLPYDIVAGPKYGRITAPGLVGPDYNYSREDLDVLEPHGVNAIVYVPRKGIYINSNQTAKQIPVSGLSKIHIRELVTYIQDEIQALLESYQWDKNTAALRSTIKAKADTILDNIKYNDGVYNYINICDETNNTPEVIDNEMIILDTEIEPSRGAGKMVHRLTIRRTGEITTIS